MSGAGETKVARGISPGEAAMMCLISAVLAVGVAIGGAIILDNRQASRIGNTSPRFATIDTQRLLSQFIADQASAGLEGEALQSATMEWTRAYNEIVRRLNRDAGYVVFDARSVAAGGEDLTDVVANALR